VIKSTAIFLLIVCLTLCQQMGIAQDVHFTQFYLSPLTTNPALTGHTPADWRFTANHRNQWNIIGKPYSTTSLGFEQNFYLYNEKFSGGLLYLHDQSGIVDLKYDKIMLSGAYHKRYGKHQFHLGFQPGMVFKSINLNGSSLPEQYDRNTGGYNSNLASSEPLLNENITFFDFNAGFNYTLKLKKLKTELGYSMFHLNKPNESFYGQENVLPVRNVLTIGAEWNMTEKLILYPHFLHMNQRKASEMLMGLNLMLLLEQNKAKATGAYVGVIIRNGLQRNTDAAIAIVGLKFKHLEVGFNYDFNISDLKYATQSRGAYEISIVYTGASSILNKTAVPCDRF
tara:strand:+ start:31997 stop:33016 length:1020 start_codon:yes stop_codon:yes gene_type:complete